MIELHTLGVIDARDPGTGCVLPLARQPKPFALLAYLALHPDPVRRDTLLALLWPELDDHRARHALRQLLVRIRHTDAGPLLVGPGADPLTLVPRTVVCDAVELRRAAEAGACADALRLYHGEFLGGFHVPGSTAFEEWRDGLARELRRAAARCAWALFRDAAAARDLPAARGYAERALELTPYDEGRWRQYLDLLVAVGEPGRALNVYRRLARRLWADLGVAPSEATRDLARRLWPGEAGVVGPGYLSSASADIEGVETTHSSERPAS